MNSKLKKTLSFAVIAVVLIGWYITIFGVGSFKNIGDQMKYGLDINGGVYVVMEAQTDSTGSDLDSLMEETKSVLENRVNAMGISESTVTIEGNDRLRVELPGVENASEAIEQIGQTAQLNFYLADGTLVMNGSEVKDAGIENDQDNGGYKITLEFTNTGSEQFEAATKQASSGTVTPTMEEEDGTVVYNNAIVIMLDDQIISAPTCDSAISGLTCEITRGSGFGKEEASSTAALIRGGALPTSLEEITSSVQTATIGVDALNKSVKAGIIGLVLVFLIMLVVYRMLGLVADIALALYVGLDLWILVSMGAVLTLPGIAGIILSIGMAVDANVIIFTRIREEIAKGKSLRVAVDAGFKKALTTVLDAQITTLIASIVLYLIGTTSVKGFALTLMIGIIISIFTAIVITQLLMGMLAESKKFGKNSFFGMNEDGTYRKDYTPHFKFIENRKKFYALSLAIILLGAGFMLTKGFNYGIDFTGGTMIQLDMGEKVAVDEVEKSIEEFDLSPSIIYAGDDNEQIIIKTIDALDNAKREEVVAAIGEDFDVSSSDVLASEEFGPSIGKELRQNAVKAILIAALSILVYVIFRFKTYKYGVAAVSGLLHDVLVTLSLYAIFGFTINNPFIAGILTVVGYSINDTIVVFDRIRENKRLYKKNNNLVNLNDSVNQTLSRSVMTSLTTLVVMLPLFILVSSTIREFIIPLLIGVFVGTYSSIFLCTPVLYDMTKSEDVSKYIARKNKEEKKKSN
ncbi:MAG: protein translocase subunit SecD [Peptostreptococcaceae bacterium]|nr:protein translocase subunit SecD [Peptostreptococcaceae bacterium]